VTDGPQDGEGSSIWDRLRRRKVVQWGIAYVAGAWGFLQGLEYVSDAFAWPNQLRQVALLVLLIGLPIVLVVAWYHGDRGEQRVSGTELSIITLLFLVGGAIFWRYDRASESFKTPNASSSTAPTQVVSDARPSIAVLPFDNRSRLEDDAFFVDGIHDDILTQLTKLSAMKVISRASVERFRDTKLPIKDIAEQLGVTRILEGGVQRAGDRVRISVQLIDAATDAHLWAESYDRELTAANIFAIQSEVATAIAAAMTASLTSAERTRLNAIPTKNLAAWEAYQLGRRELAKRTATALANAETFFQEAIDRDPSFAPPYAGLAVAIWLKADVTGQPVDSAIARAERFLGEALRLDPDLAEAVTTKAKFAHERGEYARAEAGFRRAIDLNPNYPTAHQWYSFLLGMQGRDAESSRSMQRAAELDPMSVLLQSIYGSHLIEVGQLDDGLAGLNRARTIDPLSPLPYRAMAQVLVEFYGRIGDAIPFLEKARELDPGRSSNVIEMARLHLELGAETQARHWLDQAMGNRAGNSVRGYLHLYRGERDLAQSCARQALEWEPRDGYALALLRDADLEANDAKSAYSRYAQAFPELLSPQAPEIHRLNFHVAIDLALVLQEMGERQYAVELLDRVEGFIRRIPRKSTPGYGIADVRIQALRDDKSMALAALREAERASWRGPLWRYHRDFDPTLAAIRNEPEFKAVFADIERDMARQRTELAARPKDAPLNFGPAR